MKKEKSCGAIIIDKEFNVLLLKHNAGHWAFSKGHVENHETEEETAIREIKEETNLDVDLDTNFRIINTYSPTDGVIKDVIYFLAYKRSGILKIQLEEIAEYQWLNIDRAIEMLTYDNDKEILKKLKEYLKMKG